MAHIASFDPQKLQKLIGTNDNYLRYRVTSAAIEDEWTGRLSKEEDALIDKICQGCMNGDKRILEPLFALQDRYPDLPLLDNYLIVYYETTKNREQADALIQQTYQKFPCYLFAKAFYGKWCLRNNDIIGFEDAFERKYDLKQLYPERDIFHICEFLTLYDAVCHYKAQLGNYNYIKKVIAYLEEINIADEVIENFYKLYALAVIKGSGLNFEQHKQMQLHRKTHSQYQHHKQQNRLPRGKRHKHANHPINHRSAPK